jgi:hypothetical protein
MARKIAAAARGRKVPRTSATATETIETALDLVLFRQELVAGTRKMLGVRLTSPDPTDR